MSWLKKFMSTTRLVLPYKADLGRILFPHANSLGSKERFGENLKLAFYASHIFRLGTIYVDYKTQGGFGWTHFDAAYRAVIEFKLFAADFFLFIIFFAIYGIYLNYFLYYFFGTGPRAVLRCYRQLNFHNPKAMLKDNRNLFQGLDRISIESTTKWLRILWKLVRKDKTTLDMIHFRKRLSMFPKLTKKDRVNEFLIYLVSESTVFLLILAFPFAGAVVLILFSPVLFNFTGSWFDWMVIVETAGSIYFTCHNILKSSTVLMCMVLGTTSAITFYYDQLNRFLQALVHQTRTTEMRPMIINYQLFGFYREHHRMSRLINSIGHHWKVLLCVALLANIPLNVNCVSELFLVRRRMNASHVIFANDFVFQFVIAIIAIYPSALTSTMAHRAGPNMCPLQAKITNLRLKLKWALYHEIVHNSRLTIAFHASFFGRLTVFSVVKFAFFYFEAVIFAYNKH